MVALLEVEGLWLQLGSESDLSLAWRLEGWAELQKMAVEQFLTADCEKFLNASCPIISPSSPLKNKSHGESLVFSLAYGPNVFNRESECQANSQGNPEYAISDAIGHVLWVYIEH